MASGLYFAEGDAVGELAGALSWLWRLDGPAPEPGPGAVALTTAARAPEVERMARSGHLAGAIVISNVEGPEGRPLGSSHGTANFPGFSLRGEFATVAAGGGWSPVVESSAGVHAVRRERVLWLSAPPDAEWGTLRAVWALEAIAGFLEELGMERTVLPSIGALRLDDFPGTAEFQLAGNSKSDRTQSALAARLRERARRTHSVLNVAVACRALDGSGRPTPIERIWPKAIATLAEGVEAGEVEPVCHGHLGLVPERLEEGEIDYHEFGDLGEADASALLAQITAWQRANLGEAKTFVAVDWTYSEGTRRAAKDAGLLTWDAPRLGPLWTGAGAAETLRGPLPGLAGVDLRPVRRLAELGVPPIVTLHGRSLDRRRETLDLPKDALALLRAFARRDIFRLLGLEGVRWRGALEVASAIRRHDRAQPSARAG